MRPVAKITTRVSVILPCYNEGSAIGEVVRSFRAGLPEADIFVFDNNSTDETVAKAKQAGAMVLRVSAQGKGNVLRQAFALIDADVYVVADGDGTYDAARAPELVERLVAENLDMVVGARRHKDPAAYRGGHVLGNRLFNLIVQHFFARGVQDIFSGYRVFSRPFVKSFPALAKGFETETEMTLHAIQLQLPFVEVETDYGTRTKGTASKLKTLRDGWRILFYMLRLLKHTRPFFLFSILSAVTAGISLFIGIPVIVEFVRTGLVPRFPSALAAAALMVIAAIGIVTGLILESVAYAQREHKRLAYLSVSRRLTGVGADQR